MGIGLNGKIQISWRKPTSNRLVFQRKRLPDSIQGGLPGPVVAAIATREGVANRALPRSRPREPNVPNRGRGEVGARAGESSREVDQYGLRPAPRK